MIEYGNIKKNIILFLFSISIFFSYSSFFFVELRFLYLITIIFIFFETEYFKKISLNIFKLLLIIFLTFLTHYFLNFIINFKSGINQNFSYDFSELKFLYQILVIITSVFIIYYYHKFLTKNLRNLFDIFLIIFIGLIIIYHFIHPGILFETLYTCDQGFFYLTKFIFFENSHFAIIATPVILNFIYNIDYYIKSKFLLILNILFIIFTFGNFSLTFYLTSFFSLVLIFIFYNNLSKYKLVLLIIFFFISNMFLLYGKEINQFFKKDESYCFSKLIKIDQKYNLNKNPDLFVGEVLEPKLKLKDILNKEIWNLSIGIQVYSFYVAKEALLENPFGYGINNYRNFRSKIDDKMKIVGNGTNVQIVFEETYMPKIFAPVLDFNRDSGSNNLSKIIVEFGLFGIVLLILFLILLLSNRLDIHFKFLLFPLIFSQLFIRGTGYFNSGFLIVSIILIILFIQNVTKHEK